MSDITSRRLYLMNNKLISVIIPAYNTEEFIDKCLQSVVKQIYRNLQIIVVNDGSEDGTEDIILHYARNDKRIEYYKQKNQGYGAACQAALSKARGEYLAFIDGDDIIAADYIKNLNEAISRTGSDIAACKIKQIKKHEEAPKTGVVNHEYFETDQEGGLKELIYMRRTSTGLACKLFKKHLFKNYIFPKSNYSNDYYSAWHGFIMASKIVFLDYVGYFYLQNQNSVTKRKIFTTERLLSIKYAEDNLIYISNKYPKLIKAAKNRIAIEAIVILRQLDVEKAPDIYKKCKDIILRSRVSMLFDGNIRFSTKRVLLMSYFVDFYKIYNRFK